MATQRTPHGAMEMIVRSTRSDGTRAEVWQVATREKIAEFCCINHALAFAAAGDYEAALRQIGESLKTLTTDEYSRGGDRQVRDAIASALAYPDRITIIKHDQPLPWERKARQHEWTDENGIGWRLDMTGRPEPDQGTLAGYYERKEIAERTAAAGLCVAAECPNPAVRGGYCWDHMPPAVFARFDGPNVQGHRQRQAPFNRFWRG